MGFGVYDPLIFKPNRNVDVVPHCCTSFFAAVADWFFFCVPMVERGMANQSPVPLEKELPPPSLHMQRETEPRPAYTSAKIIVFRWENLISRIQQIDRARLRGP